MKLHLVFIGMLLFTACAGKPKEVPLQWAASAPQPVKEVQLYLIIDYKTKDSGGTIPQWVPIYEDTGVQGVERLREYQDKYIFISKNSGTKFQTLQQWVSNFRVSHDFARMVSARLQDRLILQASSYPDYEYGEFFERTVKASSDAEYSGAAKEADFWIKKQYFKEDGITVDREVYDFFILVSIDKTTLKSQLDPILNNTQALIPPTREQTSAINRVRETFYARF
jgi:hypothetical protein